MANRDPSTPPKDHTVAVIGGVVALVALLVVLAIGLEAEDSPNTMAILGILGTGMAVGVVGQILNLNKTNQGVQIATRAEETSKDTNKSVKAVDRALNGNFEPRVSEIVGRVVDAKFSTFEHTLGQSIRADVTAVLQERQQEQDARIRAIVRKELRNPVSCKVVLPAEDDQ